jgi:tetratricopeptide (TPR) repeat protein
LTIINYQLSIVNYHPSLTSHLYPSLKIGTMEHIMTSKLQYVQQKKLNPADDLRETLADLESHQPRLNRLTDTEAQALLRQLDHARQLFTTLTADGTDLASEAGRFDTIQASVRQRARPLLRALGGPAALAEARPHPAPDRETRWWWYIHEDVATRQRAAVRRTTLTAGVILGLMVAVYVAFQTVLAPDPAAVVRMNAETDALLAFDESDYESALIYLNIALDEVPGDPSLLLMRGVFYDLLEQREQADSDFGNAQTALNDPIGFYLGRGQVYMRTLQFAKAEEDAQAILAVNEARPEAWLLLAQALESQGRRLLAMDAYERAGELALDSGQNEIVVMARLGLGRVSGMMP